MTDRPNTELAAIVATALRMKHICEAVANLVHHQVADLVIARLLSEGAEARLRRGYLTTN